MMDQATVPEADPQVLLSRIGPFQVSTVRRKADSFETRVINDDDPMSRPAEVHATEEDAIRRHGETLTDLAVELHRGKVSAALVDVWKVYDGREELDIGAHDALASVARKLGIDVQALYAAGRVQRRD